jgi:hypothetical protein
MEKTRPILYLLIIALLFLSFVRPELQVLANHNAPPPLGDIEPFIDGSNQEWAIEMLSMSDNSEEKIRYYNFLLHAYTFLMRYDEQDYIQEYYFVKGLWLDFLEEIPEDDIEQMLEDEAWYIDIFYPIERPFALTHDELVDVYFTFRDANPQFMSHPMFVEFSVPVNMMCDIGGTPGIVVKAYWAFAERRQEAYHHFIDTFEPIPWQPGGHLEAWNYQPPITIDVHPDQDVIVEQRYINETPVNSESNQGEETSRRNLILIFALGAMVLLVISISATRHRKAGIEPEIHVEPPELEEVEETNTDSMVTINCDFCGARVNIVKGKSEKCPYCDCIIRE